MHEVDYDELMREIPGGQNHGRKAPEGARSNLLSGGEHDRTRRSNQAGGFIPLNSDDAQREVMLREGGWSPATGTAHRGVLHPDEYVDDELLRELVSAELGFTYEQIRSVYRQGGPRTAEQRELRTAIDASVLALSHEGGNMTQLARALGLADNVIKSAIARAKEAGQL